MESGLNRDTAQARNREQREDHGRGQARREHDGGHDQGRRELHDAAPAREVGASTASLQYLTDDPHVGDHYDHDRRGQRRSSAHRQGGGEREKPHQREHVPSGTSIQHDRKETGTDCGSGSHVEGRRDGAGHRELVAGQVEINTDRVGELSHRHCSCRIAEERIDAGRGPVASRDRRVARAELDDVAGP